MHIFCTPFKKMHIIFVRKCTLFFVKKKSAHKFCKKMHISFVKKTTCNFCKRTCIQLFCKKNAYNFVYMITLEGFYKPFCNSLRICKWWQLCNNTNNNYYTNISMFFCFLSTPLTVFCVRCSHNIYSIMQNGIYGRGRRQFSITITNLTPSSPPLLHQLGKAITQIINIDS